MDRLPIGTYVLATKFSDMDPEDPWAVGFVLDYIDDRHIVGNADNTPIYSVNGFKHVRRITKEEGACLIKQGAQYRGDTLLNLLTPTDEDQYLTLVRKCLAQRLCPRSDRTGTGTIGVFGHQMRFSLRDGRFPLLTTKKMFWKGIVEELLWFISGSTDAKQLAAKGVRIWDANGSRAFLDNRGLHDNREGDLGPVYGFQWRHFGATYRGADADYQGQGVDQLADCIKQLRADPYSRRIVMSAWNPVDLPKMALPPCHMFCQFYVDSEKRLSCLLYQRSGDLGLGIPFNIASYALLCRLVAHVCGMECAELVHTIGDAHVYLNHVAALEEQLQRDVRGAPRLRFTESAADVREIDQFRADHLILDGYHPHAALPMQMAV